MKDYILFPLFTIFIVFTACAPNRERLLLDIQKIDIPTSVPFSMGDYRSSVYFIDYKNNKYMEQMHPDSIFFSSLYRFYNDEEKRQLHLIEGEDLLVESIELNSTLAHELEELCTTFKKIWRLNPKKIYLLNLAVDIDQSIWLKLLLKDTNEEIILLITDDFMNAINKSAEHLYKSEYREINPSLYYRIL